MGPAVHRDPGDVALGVKTMGAQHAPQLPDDRILKIVIGKPVELLAPGAMLILFIETKVRRNWDMLEVEDDWIIGR
jgi:hypothetical protein